MRQSSKKSQHAERGFILVSVVMFVLILTVLGTSMLTNGPLENSLITDRVNNETAFWRADAGLSRSLSTLRSLSDEQLTAVNNTALRPASLPLTNVPFTLVVQRHISIIGDSAITGNLHYATPGLASEVVIMSTGKAGGQVRTLQRSYSVSVNPGSDPRGLLNLTGGFSAKKNQTLTGRVVVPTAAESLKVLAAGVPKDSISVRALVTPDFAKFITSKIAGGSQSITGSDFSGSSAGAPLQLGSGNNGIYYAASGFSYPNGKVGYVQVYGTVYLLANGPMSFGKDLVITAGNSSATLILVSNSAGGTALDFAKQPNNNGVPTIMMTNGDVAFKKGTGESMTNISIFANDVSMDKDQTWTYNHGIMDPIMNALIDDGGLPGPSNGSIGILTPISGKWVEYKVPRLN